MEGREAERDMEPQLLGSQKKPYGGILVSLLMVSNFGIHCLFFFMSKAGTQTNFTNQIITFP